MKPAWNYLYEIEVNCGYKNPLSLVGGRVHDQTVTWFSFIPGSCIELLTDSGGGDHSFTKAASQWPPRPLLDPPREGRSRTQRGPASAYKVQRPRLASRDTLAAGPGAADLATGR